MSQVPWFSLLETLTIKPLTTQTYDGGLVMADLLSLLAHMPRLRNLGVYGPKVRERADKTGHGLQHRDLPCSLETLVLFGIVPVPTSAHIISQSRRTLRELKIIFLGHTDAEEALLIGAIAHAAPRLRVLELRAGGARQLLVRVPPLFATLVRLDSLYLEVPRQVTLQATLDALCDAPMRALSIQSTHDVRRALEPSHVDVLRLRMPSLRSIIFLGFAFDDSASTALSMMHSFPRVPTITCNLGFTASSSKKRKATKPGSRLAQRPSLSEPTAPQSTSSAQDGGYYAAPLAASNLALAGALPVRNRGILVRIDGCFARATDALYLFEPDSRRSSLGLRLRYHNIRRPKPFVRPPCSARRRPLISRNTHPLDINFT